MYFNRKNLIFILFLCLILVFVCMYRENNKELKGQSSIQTSGTPVSSHKIILDAGHGQPDRTVLYLKMEFQKRKLILILY